MTRKGELTGKFVPCENCGKLIYRTPYRLAKNKHQFCSNKCQKEYDHKQRFEDRPCEICGSLMHVSKMSTQRFCSDKCQHEWQKTRVGDLNPKTKRVNVVCDWCGKEFQKIPSVYALSDNHFCSNDCRRAWYANVCSQTDEWREQSQKRAVKILNSGVIKSVNTKPQIIINNLLDEIGINYRNEESFEYYSIDNYLVDYNLCIEVMGDFWHSSPFKYDNDNLYSNQKKTISRDKAKRTYLRRYYGIEILYLWENDIYNNLNVCETLILEYINNNGVLENYHSFNYSSIDGALVLHDNIIIPYQEMSIA